VYHASHTLAATQQAKYNGNKISRPVGPMHKIAILSAETKFILTFGNKGYTSWNCKTRNNNGNNNT